MQPIFVAFDTETNGLDPIENEICEIAGVKFKIGEDGKPFYLGQYTSMVKIEGSMTPESSAINHIYDRDLENAPLPKDAIGGFLRWVGPSAILLAHHAAFDVAFIGQAIKRYGLMVPKNPTFCTKRMACRLCAGRHRLMDLEDKLLGKDESWKKYKDDGQRHRALYDCYCLMHVFAAMLPYGVSPQSASDVKMLLGILSRLDGAKRAFDMPMDTHQLQQEVLAMRAMGVR